MKLPIRELFLGTLLVLSCCGLASAQSAQKMLQACEIVQRGSRVETDTIYLPPGNDVNQCWGFMNAVLQYATLADKDGKTFLSACPGPDTTITQVIRVFVDYARSHPEKLELKAAAVAYNAMADAFPCK
jgi:Rap1a immunity proteins